MKRYVVQSSISLLFFLLCFGTFAGFSGSFALDDYGSGYSNELNLLELSPRYIKIDISIVRGIDTDRDKQQIVSNIVAYAHARSMQLIAEGIETEAQLRTVIGLGVDLLDDLELVVSFRSEGTGESLLSDEVGDVHDDSWLRLMSMYRLIQWLSLI